MSSSSTLPSFTFGRFFLTLNAALTIVGPYMADFNETHVFNPNWPPHARFHNGQTMSMGPVLGSIILYLTYRTSASSSNSSASVLDQLSRQSADTFAAALVGSVYWTTGLSAIFYPGALAVDPEFGEGFPQLPMFSTVMALAWIGWWIESRRIEGLRTEALKKAA